MNYFIDKQINLRQSIHKNEEIESQIQVITHSNNDTLNFETSK